MVDFPFDYKAFAALMSGVVESEKNRYRGYKEAKQRARNTRHGAVENNPRGWSKMSNQHGRLRSRPEFPEQQKC